MTINIVNPESIELSEFRKLYEYALDVGDVKLERNCNGYASTTATIKTSEKSVTEYAIYPTVPNAGMAQIKSDILALTFCLRKLGHEILFLDHEIQRQEEKVTKARLSSCHTVKEIVDVLEGVNHPSLLKVRHYIEKKRSAGGRPSKNQVISVVFEDEPVETQKIRRVGEEFLRVKNEWRERFHNSKFAKMFSSLDEFCKFATDEQVQSH